MKKKCVICGKEFEVYDTRPRADCPHKRGRHTVTCSKKCSRELQYK